MADLKTTLQAEIPSFREAGHKFINKELSMMEFKGQSGGMGVYAERDGEHLMIRLKMASAVVTLDQLKIVLNLGERYKLENVHLTTREAIQLHGLLVDEVFDIMEETLEKGIYTRGGGGNFPRNVALSPLSGVEKGEAFDVTSYALIVNKYFLDRMTTFKLPRKFKVAFSNSDKDRACATATDQGFLATMKDGKPCFRVYVAGGLGKNATKGILLDEIVECTDVLYHVEAMLNLFQAEGDYQNKNKARTRYIPMRMGEEAFKECYKQHLEKVKAEKDLHLPIEIANEVEITKVGSPCTKEDDRLIEQKQEGLYTIIFHPTNGQLKIRTLKEIISYLDKYEALELRLSMTEDLYIRNLNGNEAEELLDLIDDISGKTKFERSVSCVGVPTCQIGIAQSQKMLKEILDYFKEKNYSSRFLPSLHVSGCTNSCSRHQVSEIGLMGKKKRVDGELQDVFEIYFGGVLGKDMTEIGKAYGEMTTANIPVFLYELGHKLDDKGLDFLTYFKEYKDEFDNLIKNYLIEA